MVYHDLPQPYRIQKRLALNQCFRLIHATGAIGDSLVYVTFGGEDLYDAMDLVGVFNVREYGLRIVWYEHSPDTAEKSTECPVATTLSRVSSIEVEIIAVPFPSIVEPLTTRREFGPFIYFLDYTGTFRENEENVLQGLCDAGLVRAGDFLMITSGLTARVTHNPPLMRKYDTSFRFWFKGAKLTDDFRERNHVDLFVSRALSRSLTHIGRAGVGGLSPTLLGKYRYRDSRLPMGLWLYRMDGAARRVQILRDVKFDDFPTAFEKAEKPAVPYIFD